jgi:hypothetical protein
LIKTKWFRIKNFYQKKQNGFELKIFIDKNKKVSKEKGIFKMAKKNKKNKTDSLTFTNQVLHSADPTEIVMKNKEMAKEMMNKRGNGKVTDIDKKRIANDATGIVDKNQF